MVGRVLSHDMRSNLQWLVLRNIFNGGAYFPISAEC